MIARSRGGATYETHRISDHNSDHRRARLRLRQRRCTGGHRAFRIQERVGHRARSIRSRTRFLSFAIALPCPVRAQCHGGTQPLLLSEVRIQPTNPSGRTSPTTIFDSSSLTRRFGSAAIERFGTRQFPFTHDFWCDVSGDLGLIVWATTTDGSGRERVSQMRVPVR